MGRLNEKERNALLLRFFEGKSFHEIGVACGGSENAAKKRVAYALEKLRKVLARRGVNSTTDAIAGALSANSLQIAPVGLAKAISAVAIAKGAAASASTLTLTKGALKLMAWTKTKTMIAGAATALLLSGGAVIVTLQTIHAVRRALAPDILGTWEGIDSQGATLSAVQALPGSQGTHVVLRLFKTNGVYRATTDWPELGRKDVPMGDIEYDYPNLVIHATVRDTWQLKVNEHARQMVWDHHINFIQPDPVRFGRTTAPTPVPEPLTESDFAPRPDSPLQGYWEGNIGTGPDAVPVDLKIARQADGTFRAEGDDPMEGVQGRPITVLYQPPAVEFRMADGTGTFRGQINDSGTEISGHYLQGSQSILASVRRGDYQAKLVQQELGDYSFNSKNDLQGHWKGTWIVTIAKSKAPIRQALDIAKLPDGSYSATIASVDQFGADAPAPASDFEYSPPNLHLKWKWQGVGYDGKLENSKIIGTWSEGGGGFPLVFER